MDIIPSFYNTQKVGAMVGPVDGGVFDNSFMRLGEVKKIIYPEDIKSKTQKVIEYDVLVQHKENGTFVTKLYENCFMINRLGSFADYCLQTLRVGEPSAKTAGQDTLTEPGLGSKVLILCINGATAQAVIIGGISDSEKTEIGEKAKGHHLSWEFNGVHIDINDDGSFSLEKKGATTSDGKQDPKTPEASRQTKVSVDSDGSFKVSTKDDKQTIIIDNKAAAITVKGDKRLTLHAKNIDLGQAADEFVLLGNTTVKTLGKILDEISKIKVVTSMGTSSPPMNIAQFKKIKSGLDKLLSKFVKVKKNP